ncbi:MAG: hypothetical protein FWG99_06900 [Treponema sp.]|nr:hypothetical protein [Treponema sp.]
MSFSEVTTGKFPTTTTRYGKPFMPEERKINNAPAAVKISVKDIKKLSARNV